MSQLLKLEEENFKAATRNYTQGCNVKYACNEWNKNKKQNLRRETET